MLRIRRGVLCLISLPVLLTANSPLIQAQLLPAPPRPVIVMPQAQPPPAAPAPSATHGCLREGNGYLRAQIRGARNLDIDWHNAEMECFGGPRPGSGLRLAFAGPPQGDGHRLRMVFGVAKVHEGRSGRELPTNLTVIFEGEQRLFATRGDDHCTVDQLRQERLAEGGGTKRSWRVVARGFCVSPASTLSRDERILVSRFDFAGSVVFGEEPKAPER